MNILPFTVSSTLVTRMDPEGLVQRYARQGKRVSGRTFNESRPSDTHTSSRCLFHHCLTKQRNTVVLVQSRLEIARTRFDSKAHGIVHPTVKVPRRMNVSFKTHNNTTQLYQEWLDKHFDAFQVVDTAQLAIDDAYCWVLYLDITVLNDDGNVYGTMWKSICKCLSLIHVPILKDYTVVDEGERLRARHIEIEKWVFIACLLYTSPSPRD